MKKIAGWVFLFNYKLDNLPLSIGLAFIPFVGPIIIFGLIILIENLIYD